MAIIQSFSTQNDYWSFGDLSTRRYRSGSFIADQDYNLGQIDVYLRAATAPSSGNITCYLYSDDGNEPDTVLATSTNTVDATGITSSFAWYSFNFSGYSLSNGTKYHVVIYSSEVFDNPVQIGDDAAASGVEIYYSEDAVTWASSDVTAQICIQTHDYSGSVLIPYYYLMNGGL
jgi:hypothetical protein